MGLIEDILREVERRFGMSVITKKKVSKIKKGNKTMRTGIGAGGAGRKRVIDMTGNDFLRKRGLRRDQANYVTTLIRARADMMAIRKMTMDPDVLNEIDAMSGMIQDSLEWIYALEEERGGAA